MREEKTVEAHTPAVQRKKFSTDYVFDSFGRMQEMTYPDGEKLHYAYDNGGLLKAAWGEKSGNRYDYIKTLLYDEFGQRTHITYGNGTKSTYTYNELTRRLTTLNTVLKDGREIQKLSYEYDLVGNVKVLANGILIATNTALPAGPVRQEFDYDDQYQIVDAEGWYSFGPGKENNYHNEFFYDTIGNFVKKNQAHKIIQPSMSEHLPKETNYVLNYQYKFTNNGITKPHAVSETDDKFYTYDTAGNMTGWTSKTNGTRRTITWNEENRVKQIDDNGKSTYFLYDDAGDRVVKRGEHGETIYVNRFYSIRSGELGTKSVYAGETRVVSKLVKTPPTNTANSTTTTTTTTGTGTTTIPGEQGLDNGRGKKLGIIKRLPDGYTTGVNPPVEKDEFYYHGDHLGSSNIITDAYGAVYQHLEYFPYGETWIEEGGSYGGNTPGYKFTGKELDPETGLYYYGARYYDPILSRWISADPSLGKYLPNLLDVRQLRGDWDPEKDLPGGGGVFTPLNLDGFAYTLNNPVVQTDPDGNFAWKIPFAKAYFVAEFKTGGGLSLGIATSQDLGKRHARLAQLTPEMRQRSEKVVARLEAKGYKPKIVEALRTLEEQKKKVAEGKSQTLKSMHLSQGGKGAAAIDLIDPKWGYDDSTKPAVEFFKEYGKISKDEGLTWGGDFLRKGKDGVKRPDKRTGYGWDPGHAELREQTKKNKEKE